MVLLQTKKQTTDNRQVLDSKIQYDNITNSLYILLVKNRTYIIVNLVYDLEWLCVTLRIEKITIRISEK